MDRKGNYDGEDDDTPPVCERLRGQLPPSSAMSFLADWIHSVGASVRPGAGCLMEIKSH